MNLKEASEKNEKKLKKKITKKEKKKHAKEYNVLSPPRHSKVHHDFCHCHFCRDDDQHHVLLPFSLQIVHFYVSSHRHYHYPFPPFLQRHADEFDCYCVCVSKKKKKVKEQKKDPLKEVHLYVSFDNRFDTYI